MREDIKKAINELDEKIMDLAKDKVDTVAIASMYAKDKIDEMVAESKSNINAMKENYIIFSDRAKGKASSELIKAKMNIDVAKEEFEKELAEAKENYDKAKYEEYITNMAEYAAACAELSNIAAEEAKLATLETILAKKEYEEKYGSEE